MIDLQTVLETQLERLRPTNTVLDSLGELPPCPCCDARALQGLWRDLFDLQHDCACIAERPEEYEAGLQRLWDARNRCRAYLESLAVRYRAYTFDALERRDGNAEAFDAGTYLAPGQMLYLWGNPGNGKSHLACAIGFRMLERVEGMWPRCSPGCATVWPTTCRARTSSRRAC
jgi:hypothetical protein